ncbi:SSI family serine proteinase inhibitor [Auraticoccus monumenti]|uniref:Subtilisin inhibitor-like n=1 Tax=Auraticoccus monumenti TaxID=675864 RepID=A0A1G6TUF6_9ACTN|nr:SSI family serine proteinase inhibitor [Auraticoccus monumenti]SDD32720.1 Subtilisin inhibitor-like [Auraticoccus monumenti]
MVGRAWRSGLLVVLLLAACAPGAPGASPSAPGPASSPKPLPTPPTVSPSPDRTAGPDELVVELDDGSGEVVTWQLRCDPPGGDHPDPEAACAALEGHPEALAPVPGDRMCSQQFGGPMTATLTGTWRGDPVDSRFSLTDGCEIARWNALTGLLPPAGS